MVHGTLSNRVSDVHLTQLKGIAGTLNAQKYQDGILKSGVRPPYSSRLASPRVA